MVPLVEGTYTIGRKGSSISFATDRYLLASIDVLCKGYNVFRC